MHNWSRTEFQRLTIFYFSHRVSPATAANALNLWDPVNVSHPATRGLSIRLPHLLSHCHALGSGGAFGKPVGSSTCGPRASCARQYGSVGTNRLLNASCWQPDGGPQRGEPRARVHVGGVYTRFTHHLQWAPHPFKHWLCPERITGSSAASGSEPGQSSVMSPTACERLIHSSEQH